MSREVIRTKDFVADAASFILNLAQNALAERGEFRLALSGGNTPRPVYSKLAQLGRELPWERVLITFSDERCVPPDDEQSNYRMARESLFVPAGIPQKSILRMRGEVEPRIAAQEYQTELDGLARERAESIYQHDLVILGLGEDGHTASLFPETSAVDETTERVVANFVPKLQAWRLTFTFPLINHARDICFLVNANKHSDLVERVLAGEPQYPAARVHPVSGHLTWILGEAA
ncbi:MAG: 6-phosphogluconolactonase [Verrucomicrobiota bacterium]|jgi:6-phosphogluconolactonase